MSFIRGGETITIRRRSITGVDDHGMNVYATTNITVRNVLIGIGTTVEPVDVNRDAVDATVTLYLEAGTVVEDGDVFIIRNTQWVKNGSAMEWVSPFASFEAGVVVPLKKRNG